MKKNLVVATWVALSGLSVFAAPIQEWNFNAEADGTTLDNAVNSAGSASFNLNDPNVFVTNNALRFTTDAANGNANSFAELGDPGVSTGQYELIWTISGFNMTDSSNNSGIGFGVRTGTSDNGLIRLWRASGEMRLQARSNTGATSTVYDFNATSYGNDVNVRMVINLNTDSFDTYYDLNDGNGEQAYGVATAMNTGSTLDDIRLIGATGNVWGSTSYVDVDDLSLSVIPEPATIGLVAVMSGAMLFIRRRFML